MATKKTRKAKSAKQAPTRPAVAKKRAARAAGNAKPAAGGAARAKKAPAARKTAVRKPAAKKASSAKKASTAKKASSAKKPAAAKRARGTATGKPAPRRNAAAKPARAKAPTLEQVWEYREETVYPQLFGKAQGGIFPLAPDDFAAFGVPDCDPRWLHLGVMEFAPTAGRSSWLYVTSGGSTPWDTKPSKYDPDDYSWLGVELVVEAPRRAEWPIRLLRRMLAFHVLAMHDYFGDRPGLGYGMRAPIGDAIDGSEDSVIRFMAIAEPKHYPATVGLPSGKLDFLHIVGITEGERDHAKQVGTDKLVAKLAKRGAWPVTDPKRRQVAL